MAARRSTTIERKTPQRMRCRVILEKRFSTALSQGIEQNLELTIKAGMLDETILNW